MEFLSRLMAEAYRDVTTGASTQSSYGIAILEGCLEPVSGRPPDAQLHEHRHFEGHGRPDDWPARCLDDSNSDHGTARGRLSTLGGRTATHSVPAAISSPVCGGTTRAHFRRACLLFAGSPRRTPRPGSFPRLYQQLRTPVPLRGSGAGVLLGQWQGLYLVRHWSQRGPSAALASECPSLLRGTYKPLQNRTVRKLRTLD